ncbi:MAG: hypothetical protein ACXWQR_09500 [Ktedonobacterales bacterium]
MSDNGQHVNGQMPPAPPATTERGSIEAAHDSFDTTSAVLRLLIGGLLVGADELRLRLRQWEATAHSAPSATVQQTVPQSLRHAPAPASLRYAFIGMLFETETRMRQQLSTVLTRLARLSEETEYLYVTTVEPALSQTPLDPVLMRLDEMLFKAGAAVDRWTARGWLEEQQSRGMARQASVSVVDELIDYMARNPEVRELIEQQGVSMAGEAVDEVRERTASADMWVERLTRSLLRRPANHEAAVTPNEGASPTGDAGGQPNEG